MKRIALLALLAATLVCWAPLACLLLAATTASALGCALDEGSAHPCFLGHADLGDALYTGAVLGWVALVTWPGMIVSLVLWIWLAARRARRRRRA